MSESRVIVHMAASLDGFISRRDGSVDWMEIVDEFAGGETLTAAAAAAFVKTIDCYVMGSRTYETALDFEAKGLGWAYGETPTLVLTNRTLPRTRDSVEFYSGSLNRLLAERLKPRYRTIWVAGGGAVAGNFVRHGLADELQYSVLPIVIGDGIRFFEGLDRDVALHLLEVKAYTSGTVALRYDIRRTAATPA
ncbi:bifunctional deaminase-reductase domain protein [Hyaloraphidium curvatum]|nr:bifunctional deaminase-reductase domain protein [Hyaloraphidium curvatum]